MRTLRLLTALFLSVSTFSMQSAFAKNSQIRVKFTSPHIPLDVTKHGADQFRKSLEKLTAKQATVDFNSYSDGKAKLEDVLRDLQKGEFSVTQIYVDSLTSRFPQLYAFEVPYLFESHDHVAAFANSSTGKGLLASLETGGLKGLGFTYSGGERVVISNQRIEKYEDFDGLRYRIEPNEGNIMSQKILNATLTKYEYPDALVTRKSPLDMLNAKQIDAGDAIYTDLPQVLNDSPKKNHFVVNEIGATYLMSVIVMDLKYFNKLPAHIQKAVVIAGADAANSERNYAIAQERKGAEIAVQAEWEIYKMSPPERARMKEALSKVVDAMTKKAGTAIVESIRALAPSPATLSKVD